MPVENENKHKTPKSVGHNKNNFEREVNSNTSQFWEIKKISNKQPNFASNEIKKEQTKSEVRRRKKS